MLLLIIVEQRVVGVGIHVCREITKQFAGMPLAILALQSTRFITQCFLRPVVHQMQSFASRAAHDVLLYFI